MPLGDVNAWTETHTGKCIYLAAWITEDSERVVERELEAAIFAEVTRRADFEIEQKELLSQLTRYLTEKCRSRVQVECTGEISYTICFCRCMDSRSHVFYLMILDHVVRARLFHTHFSFVCQKDCVTTTVTVMGEFLVPKSASISGHHTELHSSVRATRSVATEYPCGDLRAALLHISVQRNRTREGCGLSAAMIAPLALAAILGQQANEFVQLCAQRQGLGEFETKIYSCVKATPAFILTTPLRPHDPRLFARPRPN